MKKSLIFVCIALLVAMSLIVSCDNSSKTPTVEKFTVTLDPNGGGQSYTVEVEKGKTLPEQKIPTREGYTFEGWLLENEMYDFSKPVTSNITLVAKWNIIKLTVTFDTSGGNSIDPKSIDYGSKVTLPSNPTKDGYYFIGWIFNNSLFDSESLIKNDITLKALWSTETVDDIKQYVAFNSNTNIGYKDLISAYNDSTIEQSVILLKDISLSSVFLINKSITINGNGHNIYNTANRVIRITASGLDVKLINLGIISKCTDSEDVRGISFDNSSSNSSLLLDNCTVSAPFYAINIVPGVEKLTITIKDGTVAAGWAAINSYSNNSKFIIENSTLKGLNDKGESSWNDFATIVFDGNGLKNSDNIGVYGINNVLNISNSTIYASSESDNNQAWLALQYGAQNNTICLDNKVTIIDESNNTQEDNWVAIPFVNWTGTRYTKSYDIHSKLIIDGLTETICYHGELDKEALVETGTHIPYEGCTTNIV